MRAEVNANESRRSRRCSHSIKQFFGGPPTGFCCGLGDRMAACPATSPLILQSRHVESQPRSKPEQYSRRGDGAHPLRRSPRHDPILLPSDETLEETAKVALGA